MKLRGLWAGLIPLFLWACAVAPAKADPPIYAQAVTSCGSPNNTPVAGQPYPLTMNLQGLFCGNVAIGATVGQSLPGWAMPIGYGSGGALVGVTTVNNLPVADATLLAAAQASVGTSGSSAPSGIGYNGGRAATADPTAVTDGQIIALQLTKTGRTVVAPYSIPELMVRGSASTTGNSSTTIIASAGGSLKNYITAVQCWNSSAVTITVAFNDSATTTIIVPAGSGNNISYATPLATAAATAFQFTPASSQTTIGCAAQGYTGL